MKSRTLIPNTHTLTIWKADNKRERKQATGGFVVPSISKSRKITACSEIKSPALRRRRTLACDTDTQATNERRSSRAAPVITAEAVAFHSGVREYISQLQKSLKYCVVEVRGDFY